MSGDALLFTSSLHIYIDNEFFDIIEEVHCRQKGHIGSKKTIQVVKCTVSVRVCYVIFMVRGSRILLWISST